MKTIKLLMLAVLIGLWFSVVPVNAGTGTYIRTLYYFDDIDKDGNISFWKEESGKSGSTLYVEVEASAYCGARTGRLYQIGEIEGWSGVVITYTYDPVTDEEPPGGTMYWQSAVVQNAYHNDYCHMYWLNSEECYSRSTCSAWYHDYSYQTWGGTSTYGEAENNAWPIVYNNHEDEEQGQNWQEIDNEEDTSYADWLEGTCGNGGYQGHISGTLYTNTGEKYIEPGVEAVHETIIITATVTLITTVSDNYDAGSYAAGRASSVCAWASTFEPEE